MIIFRVIIAGSRKFNAYETLREKCDKILAKRLADADTQVVIISGCARGADSLGERYAAEKGLQIERFPADWDKYGKSAGYRRNVEMAAAANALIAFPKTGEANKGTLNMIAIAKVKGLQVRVIRS